MSNEFVTSDLHIDHKQILTYEPISRPFTDLEEMHNELIIRWNSKVNSKDHVYILGDVSFGNISLTKEILSQLNGTKTLVKGNHDAHLLKKTEFCQLFQNQVYDILEKKLIKNGTLCAIIHC